MDRFDDRSKEDKRHRSCIIPQMLISPRETSFFRGKLARKWRDNGENFKFHFAPVGKSEDNGRLGELIRIHIGSCAVARDTTRETYFPLVSLVVFLRRSPRYPSKSASIVADPLSLASVTKSPVFP